MKVESRHFRRTKCLDIVALDILIVIRDFRRSAKDFCDILHEINVVCVAKVIAAWKFCSPSADSVLIALELTLLIADEHRSRRYEETTLAFFRRFPNRLVKLLSALYCNKHCIRRRVIRHFLTTNREFRTEVMESTPPDKEVRSDLPSELGFALAPRETDPAPV